MSLLFKKVAAQDEKAYGVPADLWNKIRGFQCSYIIANELKNGKSIEEVEARLDNSAVGSQIPGRYNDFMKGVEVLREMKKRGLDSCGEDSAQHDSNEEIFMNSHIRLFNEAKEKGDAKFLDWLKRSWNAAKVKPNYKAMSNNPAYRKLDKLAQDSAAMDDLNDGIKTIENKARALIADAKNARSKYADILARSEIAKNNAQVKKTFEDDIARCDKLINALKAI